MTMTIINAIIVRMWYINPWSVTCFWKVVIQCFAKYALNKGKIRVKCALKKIAKVK